MPVPTDILGVGIFTVTYFFDVYVTAGESLRRKARQTYNWTVSQTDLLDLPLQYPPAAGSSDSEPPEPENYRNVFTAGYTVALLFILVAILDASEFTPPCFPYHSIVATYGKSLVVAVVGLMWFSEGQHITVQYHAPIRFALGLFPVLITIYTTVCTGSGPL